MNRRLRLRPPKARLPQRSGSAMNPIRLALGIEYLDPVELGVAHAPAAPQVAVHVDTEAIGRAIRLRCDQNALVDNAGAVVDDIISINGARVWAAVLDITFALVGRELHAVRQIERALHHRGLTGPRVETNRCRHRCVSRGGDSRGVLTHGLGYSSNRDGAPQGQPPAYGPGDVREQAAVDSRAARLP